MKNHRLILLLIACLQIHAVFGQNNKQNESSEIYLQLKKLNVLGNILYVAAHPDDENTRVIAYMSKGKLLNTAYLAMTRGDGGQNLIGPEIREQLGIVRTQELLAARKIDGGRQFFTRANDFGYSKNTEETQKIWNRKEVLGDVVWTFRKFRPDIILMRFPPDERAGHGHHTTSAILAIEAFKLSGDPKAYSDQLKYADTWKPSKIFMNTGRWWNASISADDEGVVVADVGEYNPLLGISYSEMAAISRSQHKSQGFGSSGSRGEQIEYFEYVDGLQDDQLFGGMDFSWNRVRNGKEISKMVDEIVTTYDIGNPSKSIPQLLELRKKVDKIDDKYWKDIKLEEIDQLLKQCAGLYLEANASTFHVVPGQQVNTALEVTNRSDAHMQLKGFRLSGASQSINKDLVLNKNEPLKLASSFSVDADAPLSNPYWLNKEGTLGMYRVDDQLLIGKAENDPAFTMEVSVLYYDTEINYRVPVTYKWNDRVKGEQRRRVEVIPPIMVSLMDPVVIFPDEKSKELQVKIIAGSDSINSDISLQVPPGWGVNPSSQSVHLDKKSDVSELSFTVQPPAKTSEGKVVVVATINGKTYSSGIKEIIYDHIPVQTLFPEASSKLVRLEIERRGALIGYIQGAGDAVPQSLEAIGYNVWQMKPEDITEENLKTLDALILGVRILNTHPEIKNYKSTLMKYVSDGGNLIYQYNTTRGINWEDFAPYELKFTGRSSDSRVSVEEAPIRILKSDHPVLNYPNKITMEDFDGWVQERGLYFPSEWADEYEAILSSNDPGEPVKDGGLLVAKYGKGYFVYSGYSWFRELPAGVPGAYRMFANIVSLGNDNKPDSAHLKSDN